jgi:hypothetical protein
VDQALLDAKLLMLSVLRPEKITDPINTTRAAPAIA